ncbi:MAG: hypothetical protein KC464_21710 [Myxococcales bacterium]|nr:hypothetical protein [Myxococcales bacterium]
MSYAKTNMMAHVATVDALYDEDPDTARVDVPPRSWRGTHADVSALLAFAQEQLDTAWQRYRADVRADRLAAKARRGRSLSELAGVARDELLARLAALQARHGTALQVAHRKRDSVSDDELRSLIADLESLDDEEPVR